METGATASRSGRVTLAALLCVAAGLLDVFLGLDARGVSPGEIERNVFGEPSPWILDLLGTAGILTGALQMLAAFCIWLRIEPARIAAVTLAMVGLLLALTVRPTLDGWALSGLVLNLAIVVILSTRSELR